MMMWLKLGQLTLKLALSVYPPHPLPLKPITNQWQTDKNRVHKFIDLNSIVSKFRDFAHRVNKFPWHLSKLSLNFL